MLVLKPYDLRGLDDKIKSLNNVAIFFDYVHSPFRAVVRKDGTNLSVFYGELKSRRVSDEEFNKTKNYHDDLPAMIGKCVVDILGPYVNDRDLTRIVDVVYIPEIKGLCFLTAGYKIGCECMKAVYGDVKSDSVEYVITENTKRIQGDDLKRIAARCLFEDINISCALGYAYYNSTLNAKRADEKAIGLADLNDKRFGHGNVVRDLCSLMRNFKEFVPIGYSWNTYTPFWFTCPSFVQKLKDETILGCDWVEAPNFAIDGTRMRDSGSKTVYTTRKRITQMLGKELKNCNFRFINEIIAGLFLDGDGITGSKFIAVNKDDKRRILTPIEFKALTADEDDDYVIAGSDANAQVRSIPAAILVNKYWDTMMLEDKRSSDGLKEKVSMLSLENIYTDVIGMSKSSAHPFGYID